jgi:methyl-accepting chemotaxis protein
MKNLKMKSLKTRFLALFIGLSVFVALAVGLLMYVQYHKYIKASYEDTLKRVTTMIEKQYPILTDIDYLEREAAAMSDELRELCRQLDIIAQSFDMAYVYYMRRVGDKYQYLVSSDGQDIMTPLYSAEDTGIEADIAYDTQTIQIAEPTTSEAWGTLISGFLPVVKNGVTVGVIGADYHVSFVKTLEQRAGIALALALVVVIVLSIAPALAASSSLVNPIRELERIAASLATLNFDVSISRLREDEIGAIQRAFLNIRDSLREAIDNLQTHLLKMTDTGKSLSGIVRRSSQALEVITGSMNAMQTKADSQLQSIEQTALSVTDIATRIDSLNQAVRTQKDHITQSSAAIEQMVANIGSIRSVATHAGETTTVLGASSETGRKLLAQLSHEVWLVQNRSASLQNANQTIANIAAQTNILAMNAAIEAAHAGEAGKGFAVVAGEIRKLAELSSKESGAITDEIKAMENAIDRITKVSVETMKAMDEIFTEITAMNSSFNIIHQAVEEQSAGGDQILQALKAIQDMTNQVQDGSGAIRQESDMIHKEVESLKDISREVTEQVQEVRLAGRHIGEFLDEAKGIAQHSSRRQDLRGGKGSDL